MYIYIYIYIKQKKRCKGVSCCRTLITYLKKEKQRARGDKTKTLKKIKTGYMKRKTKIKPKKQEIRDPCNNSIFR